MHISVILPSISEKTNNNPLIKTAYLTISGDAMKSGEIQLSHTLDEIRSGEIGCLLGHPESFLSTRGMKLFQYNFFHFCNMFGVCFS